MLDIFYTELHRFGVGEVSSFIFAVVALTIVQIVVAIMISNALLLALVLTELVRAGTPLFLYRRGS